jgi:LCP family protein required for cell wall assembly
VDDETAEPAGADPETSGDPALVEPATDPEPGSDPAPGDVPPGRRHRRRRWVSWAAIGVAVLLVVLGGGAAVYAWRLNSNLDRFGDPFAALPNRPAAATPDPSADAAASERTAMNVLVLGSDSRISAGDPSSWEAGAQRTDTIMLVHLPAAGGAAYVMSIPRDSWVPIPGHGTAKINAAYSYGGPALLIETVEALSNVRIDHFALTDFESFSTLTDTLGGVDLTLKEDLYSRKGHELLVPAGDRTLNGEQALIWVRERYSLTRGDFDRVQRQQAWLRAIMEKVSKQGILDDPSRTLAFLDDASKAVSVDDGVTLGVLKDLANRMRGVHGKAVHFLTVPIAGTGRSPDGKQSIVNLSRPAFDHLMEAVAADQVDQYLAANPKAVDQLGSVAP